MSPLFAYTSNRSRADGQSAARTKPFAIAKPETSAIPRLVIGPHSDIRGVAGIGLLEFTLTFEVPMASVDTLVFLPCLSPLDQPSVIARPVCPRVVLRNDRARRANGSLLSELKVFLTSDDAIAVFV